MNITPRRFRILFGLLLVAGTLAFAALNIRATEPQGIAAPLAIEQQIAKSGTHYTIFHKNGAHIALTDTRPSVDNPSILLSIPAAFTVTSTNAVDGIFVVDGSIRNSSKVNRNLGGAMHFIKGNCAIFPTDYGAKLTPEFMQQYANPDCHFFQQLQIVVNGKAESFKDQKVFQRRAIVLTADRKVQIIESDEAVTLAAFSHDLVELGAHNAIYTDMGAWDEGWYRNKEGNTAVIGKDLSQTARQSNWVVFSLTAKD